MNTPKLRMLVISTCIVGLAVISVGMTSTQDDPRAGEVDNTAPKFPIEVFRLKHSSADDVSSALRNIASYRPDLGESLAVEHSTNTLLLSLTPERMRIVRPLIAELDAAQDPRPEYAVEVLRLQHTDAGEAHSLLTRIFPHIPLAIDARNNGVIAQADSETVTALRALISQVDVPTAGEPGRDDTQLQMRIIWLVEGAKHTLHTPPSDLRPVLDELSRFGVDDVTMVGQSILRTTPGEEFHHSFGATIEHRWNVEFAGTVGSTDDEGWRTRLMLSAMQQSSAAPVMIQHDTTIVTKTGRFVVLAMSPTSTMTSVFVLQIMEVDG